MLVFRSRKPVRTTATFDDRRLQHLHVRRGCMQAGCSSSWQCDGCALFMYQEVAIVHR